MKAFYKKIDSRYYKINQSNVRTPANISRMGTTHTSVSCNCSADTVGIHVWVETMDKQHPPTNRKLVGEMKEFLKENLVTQIDTLEDNYKVYLDYTILDTNGNQVEHSVSLMDVMPIDAIRPLGINCYDELIYRQVKILKPQFNLVLTRNIPFGIMQTKTGSCEFQINDIIILQEFAQNDNTPSMYCGCYKYGSSTIQSTLENMMTIYSTKNEGIVIEGIGFSQVPRRINIDLEFSLSDEIIVYDDGQIDAIIEENTNHMDPDTDDTDYDGVCGCNPCPVHKPDPKPEPPIEDDTEPEIYELCSKLTANHLVVVSDYIMDKFFDSESMVRKKDVLPSIPTIEVGDCVVIADKDWD